MRRTAVLALAAAALAACSDRITSPDAPAPGGPSFVAAPAAAAKSTVAPIVFLFSQPRVVASLPGGLDFFRYPNRPAAEVGGSMAAWQYRDDAFYGPRHVQRAPLSGGAATELAQVDYDSRPAVSDRYTAWQSGDSTVMVVENATGRRRQLAAPGTVPTTLRLVGDRLALLRRTRGSWRELVVYDLVAGTEGTLAVLDADDGTGLVGVLIQGAFDFDGRYAAYGVTRNNLNGIMAVDTRTGRQRLAVPYRGGAISGPWVDAGRMVYSVIDGSRTSTYAQDLATGATRVVSTAAPPVPQPYPDTRLRQKDPRISGNLVVWTDTRRDSTQDYPQHTDVYLYDLATGVEMPVAATAAGWSGDARVSGNHILWTQSRYASGLVWDLVTEDVTPVSVPVLLAELKKMEAAGTVPASPLGRVLETFLAGAQGPRTPRSAAVAHLRDFASTVHRNAGTRIAAAAAERLEGIASGVILRLTAQG